MTNTNLHEHLERVNELQAEVDEMRGECYAHGIELTEARAEIERLRAALLRIANLNDLTEADMVALEALGNDKQGYE